MAHWKYHPNIPAEIDIPNKSIHEIFFDSVDECSDLPFLYFEGNTITYQEAGEKVQKLANALKNLGLKKGDRIALFMPNCPQYVIGYMSILSIGGIVTAISPLYTAKEIKHQLKDSGSKAILTLDMFLDKVREVREETNLEHVIASSIADELSSLKGILYRLVIGRKNPKIQDDELSYSQLLKDSSDTRISVKVNPKEDLAALQYTGGTTGVPKGAMLTHHNLVSQMVILHYWEEWIGGPIPGVQRANMGALPFSHIFGLTTAMLWPIYAGGSILLIPDPRKLEDVLKGIEKYNIQFFNAVPLLFQKLADHPKVGNYNLSSLRQCISGGCSLHPKVLEKFEEKTGATLVEGYGLSEASPVTHINPADRELRKINIGMPIPNTEAKIVDLESGEDLKEFSVKGDKTPAGELLIRGPQVMKGYWNRPEATNKVLTEDGWLRTGDVACMDKDGYFAIIDRLKDVIFTSGYQVWPLEVEEVLCNHPDISMAAVIPVTDDQGNELVKAVIVPENEESKPSKEELRAFCKKNLAPYKVPRFFEYREELPLSAVGKVLRRPLREEACMKVKQT
ncbi:MAG: AMP-binding protein [Candidatus Heimdallarchaeota archaeon]|nr:AMP-binding protein [Candidatus Heimdallarchaeota archaeon]